MDARIIPGQDKTLLENKSENNTSENVVEPKQAPLYESKLKTVDHLNTLEKLMTEIESLANDPVGTNYSKSDKCRMFIEALDKLALNLNEKLVAQFEINPDLSHQSAESQIVERIVKMLQDVEQ